MLHWAHEWGVEDEPALAHALAGSTAPPPPAGAPGEPDPETPEGIVGAGSGAAQGLAPSADPTPAPPLLWGVNVAAFLRAELGIGRRRASRWPP